MRRVPPLAAGVIAALALALTACQSELVCTQIGGNSGVSVTVAAPIPAELVDSHQVVVTACWDGGCEDATITVGAETVAVDDSCSGSEPSDTCAATMRPTGRLEGFAVFEAMPTSAVDVSVAYGAGGAAVRLYAVQVEVRQSSPNGAQCPPTVNQAAVIIDGGALRGGGG